MRIDFTKMHGAGNDFVVFDSALPHSLLRRESLQALANRRTGIGFDQALVIEAPRSTQSAAYYRIFNADGDEVEQCGNGARCVAMLLHHRGMAKNGELKLDSPAGPSQARIAADGSVSVALGVPDFEPRSLPFEAPAEADQYALEVAGQRLAIGAVSLGNPHAVLTVASVESATVETLGPAIEHHPRFPKQVNVAFLEILTRNAVRLRVYERGAGETRSCGTGACAAVAVTRRSGLLDPSVRVQVPGGELRVDWVGTGEPIWLSGPAQISFQGHLEV